VFIRVFFVAIKYNTGTIKIHKKISIFCKVRIPGRLPSKNIVFKIHDGFVERVKSS
jgi:hypothetical protein